MFDASTAALFTAALGLKKSEMLVRYGIIGIPMVDTGAKFQIPSRFGDVITIESHVASFQRSSFNVMHRVFHGGTIAIEAHEVRVWAGRDPHDPERIRGVAIPDEVKSGFQKTGSQTRAG
jgi:4-hydroxybenzoyl-CoA thioesterase